MLKLSSLVLSPASSQGFESSSQDGVLAALTISLNTPPDRDLEKRFAVNRARKGNDA